MWPGFKAKILDLAFGLEATQPDSRLAGRDGAGRMELGWYLGALFILASPEKR